MCPLRLAVGSSQGRKAQQGIGPLEADGAGGSWRVLTTAHDAHRQIVAAPDHPVESSGRQRILVTRAGHPMYVSRATGSADRITALAVL